MYFLLSIWIFGACTLSATQEKKLNESLSNYLNSRNECLVVSYVAFTYPDLVLTYKSQGDSVFKNKFDCNHDSLFLQDPTIRQTVKSESDIHVLYEIDLYNVNTGLRSEKKHQLVALSKDNGKSWFFMDEVAYVDKMLLPNLNRLIIQ